MVPARVSVNVEYEHAALTPAAATQVRGISAGREHIDLNRFRLGNDAGRERHFQLRIADNGRAECRAIDYNFRGGDKVTAVDGKGCSLLDLREA